MGRWSRIRLLLSAWLLVFDFAAGHLLNMTEVTAKVSADGTIALELRVDLSKELGTAEAYFTFAQSPVEVMGGRYAELWEEMRAAIQLTIDDILIPLTLGSVELPAKASLADFKSPFEWPRTVVRMSGQVPPGGHQMQFTFLPRFAFEEPIALSMQEVETGRSKSRWLVAAQASPRFTLTTPNAQTPILAEEPAGGGGAALWSYLKLGFVHIVPRGLDHLFFVLGLYLGARSTRTLWAQVSVFTIAHSVTLALASWRIIEPPGQAVEILIALSIGWVGVDNLRSPEVGRSRLLVVALFGLLHGMGFAGALAQLPLPADDFLLALLGFNLGVEAGQLAFIGMLLLVLGWFRGAESYRQRVVLPLSGLVLMTALFWVITRL